MPLLAAVLSPCQGLVLQEVEQDVWFRLEGIELGRLQEVLQVVPPGTDEGAKPEDPRSSQSSGFHVCDEVVLLGAQAEALPVGPF